MALPRFCRSLTLFRYRSNPQTRGIASHTRRPNDRQEFANSSANSHGSFRVPSLLCSSPVQLDVV